MRTGTSALTSVVALGLAFVACGKNNSAPRAPEPTPPASTTPPAPSTPPSSSLKDPSKLNAEAPAVYRVKFATTKGDFVLEVQRQWAPRGADRFYNLVKAGFYDKVKFFRAIKGFMVQFGINGDPAVSQAWANASIADDPVVKSNTRGYITFATAGANTRTTQVFINLVDNVRLDASGFSPFGQVVTGMEVVDALYTDYGEGAPRGRGPSQGRIEAEGNAYLERDFPNLDAVNTATVEN
jgi:peptidyl-prolyl cis-trans isomerase A (cyclophilin A)